MGTGNENKVRPKEPLAIKAEVWNSLIDMLREWKRSKEGNSGLPVDSLIQSKLNILVENFTADTLPVYSVLAVGGMNVTLNSILQYTYNIRPGVSGFTPTSAEDCIVILQQPSDGATGIGLKACIRGVTLAYVRMNSVFHQWANPIPGVTGYLDSTADCGAAKILDFVDIPQSGSGGSGGSYGYGYGSGYLASDVKLALIDLVNGCRGGSSGVVDLTYHYESVNYGPITTYHSSGLPSETTGFLLDLPSAGNYLLYMGLWTEGKLDSGGLGGTADQMEAVLWNNTDSSVIPGTRLGCVCPPVELINIRSHNTLLIPYTANGAKELELRVGIYREGSTAWLTSLIRDDNDKSSKIGYIKIG